MSNDPRVLVELKPHEASWMMDILHDEWNRRVMQGALTGGMAQYSYHVLRWYKWRASMLLSRIDDNADKQGFGSL